MEYKILNNRNILGSPETVRLKRMIEMSIRMKYDMR
jgi:hypothetical protein